MDRNDNKNGKGGKNGSNMRGAASLVAWALVLTIVVSYASSVMGSTGSQSSSVKVKYSEFVDMVESGQVVRSPWDAPPAH